MITEGWGGNGVLMLDVSNPVPGSGPPFQLLWSAADHNQSARFDGALGLTVSVPAFTFVPGTDMNDHRVIMVSGYPVDQPVTAALS